MSAISTSIHDELTLMCVVGELTVADCISNIKQFYENNPTLYLVVDMRQARLANFEAPSVNLISNIITNFKSKRRGGKTAIIAPDDLIFGISRMFDATMEIKNAEFTFTTFRTLDEAQDWIKIKIPDLITP